MPNGQDSLSPVTVFSELCKLGVGASTRQQFPCVSGPSFTFKL